MLIVEEWGRLPPYYQINQVLFVLALGYASDLHASARKCR
jgi:hypothetical protein